MEELTPEKIARLRLISMFFMRLANDLWTEIHNMKSKHFKRYWWVDVSYEFNQYWKKVRRQNENKTEDDVCELVDMMDEKIKLMSYNIFNVLAKHIKSDDLELCVKVYIFSAYLSASFSFANCINDVKTCKAVNNVREAVDKFMNTFTFPYQNEQQQKEVYEKIEPYFRDFIDLIKSVKINVKKS